jgi:hypothetical protein
MSIEKCYFSEKLMLLFYHGQFPIIDHSWASASRSMPTVSAFRHPVSQSGTGVFRYRIGSSYSGTGLGPLIPVPEWFRHQHFYSFRCRTDWIPDSPTFRHLKKGCTKHVHTAGFGGYETDTQSTSKLQVVESDIP